MNPSSESPLADAGPGSRELGGLPSTGARRSPSSTGPELAAVAGTATEQGGEVLKETGRQARSLLRTSRDELRDQAGEQQRRIAGGLSQLGDELRTMARSAPEPGIASEVADQAAERLAGVSTWLEQREPGQLVEEVRRFAARRPGTFLAVALGAGVVAGRITRSVATDSASGSAAGAPRSAPEHYDIRDAGAMRAGGPMSGAPIAGAPEPSLRGEDLADEWSGSSMGSMGSAGPGREMP